MQYKVTMVDSFYHWCEDCDACNGDGGSCEDGTFTLGMSYGSEIVTVPGASNADAALLAAKQSRLIAADFAASRTLDHVARMDNDGRQAFPHNDDFEDCVNFAITDDEGRFYFYIEPV